jgi:hypothetical protein
MESNQRAAQGPLGELSEIAGQRARNGLVSSCPGHSCAGLRDELVTVR